MSTVSFQPAQTPYAEECPICCEPLHDAVYEHLCGLAERVTHAFHKWCLARNFLSQPTPACPMCRAQVGNADAFSIWKMSREEFARFPPKYIESSILFAVEHREHLPWLLWILESGDLVITEECRAQAIVVCARRAHFPEEALPIIQALLTNGTEGSASYIYQIVRGSAPLLEVGIDSVLISLLVNSFRDPAAESVLRLFHAITCEQPVCHHIPRMSDETRGAAVLLALIVEARVNRPLQSAESIQMLLAQDATIPLPYWNQAVLLAVHIPGCLPLIESLSAGLPLIAHAVRARAIFQYVYHSPSTTPDLIQRLMVCGGHEEAVRIQQLVTFVRNNHLLNSEHTHELFMTLLADRSEHPEHLSPLELFYAILSSDHSLEMIQSIRARIPNISEAVLEVAVVCCAACSSQSDRPDVWLHYCGVLLGDSAVLSEEVIEVMVGIGVDHPQCFPFIHRLLSHVPIPGRIRATGIMRCIMSTQASQATTLPIIEALLLNGGLQEARWIWEIMRCDVLFPDPMFMEILMELLVDFNESLEGPVERARGTLQLFNQIVTGSEIAADIPDLSEGVRGAAVWLAATVGSRPGADTHSLNRAEWVGHYALLPQAARMCVLFGSLYMGSTKRERSLRAIHALLAAHASITPHFLGESIMALAANPRNLPFIAASILPNAMERNKRAELITRSVHTLPETSAVRLILLLLMDPAAPQDVLPREAFCIYGIVRHSVALFGETLQTWLELRLTRPDVARQQLEFFYRIVAPLDGTTGEIAIPPALTEIDQHHAIFLAVKQAVSSGDMDRAVFYMDLLFPNKSTMIPFVTGLLVESLSSHPDAIRVIGPLLAGGARLPRLMRDRAVLNSCEIHKWGPGSVPVIEAILSCGRAEAECISHVFSVLFNTTRCWEWLRKDPSLSVSLHFSWALPRQICERWLVQDVISLQDPHWKIISAVVSGDPERAVPEALRSISVSPEACSVALLLAIIKLDDPLPVIGLLLGTGVVIVDAYRDLMVMVAAARPNLAMPIISRVLEVGGISDEACMGAVSCAAQHNHVSVIQFLMEQVNPVNATAASVRCAAMRLRQFHPFEPAIAFYIRMDTIFGGRFQGEDMLFTATIGTVSAVVQSVMGIPKQLLQLFGDTRV